MTGQALRRARKEAGMTQGHLARLLRVTQPYVSLLERDRRRVPNALARALVRVLNGSATELPVDVSPGKVRTTSERLVDELARLQYPGFAYLRRGKATQNPAEVLLSALALGDVEARLLEALPWLLLEFDRLDVSLVVREAKLQDLQNRLGFVVSLAREVAERNPVYRDRLDDLRQLERCLEPSKLARDEFLGGRANTDRMKAWVRDRSVRRRQAVECPERSKNGAPAVCWARYPNHG